ncbi:MAG: hypothetical protein KGM24_00035 [Elusimicrobia bacterium]|nr:hypothetical protein [Elusimicrobiota bacterium]
MKKALALSALLLACAASVRAQEFFGLTPGDVQGMVARARAEARLKRLESLGYEPGGLEQKAGRLLGTIETPSSRQDCIIDAVIAHMGVRPPYDTIYPDVLRESETNESLYEAAVKAQFPGAPAPVAFRTLYLPDDNVIYLNDSASYYKDGRTMDGELAGEYARFFDWNLKHVGTVGRLDADAAAVESWYESAYPAGTSSCGR